MPHAFARAALLVAFVLTSAPAYAQTSPPPESPDSVATPLEGALPEVHVEATRDAESAASFGMRLRAADLDAATAPSVADALETRTGLAIRRYGPGGLATASLRGAGAAQTLVLLDGMRLADPQTGVADLALLPSFLLGGASVSHGAASAHEGSGALGGVVRLTTPTEAPSLHVAASAGAYGERALGAMTSGSAGRAQWLVATEARAADEAFSYVRSVTAGVPEDVRREGADRVIATALARLTWRARPDDIAAPTTTAALWLTHADRGLPGPGNAPASGARQWNDATRLWLTHDRKRGAARFSVRATASLARLRFRNPAARDAANGGVLDITHRTQSATLGADARRAFGSRVAAHTFAEVGADGSALRGGVSQQRGALGFGATWLRGGLTLAPALRLDVQRTSAPDEAGLTTSALSPRIVAELAPHRRLALRASLSRSFRTPTLSERYAVPGGTPGLRPERGWSADAGAYLDLLATGVLTVETSIYLSRLRDAIVWQPSYVSPGVQVWRARGLGRTETTGLELAVATQTPVTQRASIRGRVVYAWTRAEDRSDATAVTFGEHLPYVPVAHLAASSDAVLRLTRTTLGAGGALRLVGQRPIAADGSQHLDAYRVLDLHASAAFRLGTRRLRATLALRNALDARYEIIRLYPMPPRHARFTIDLTL